MITRCECVTSEGWSGSAVMRYLKYGLVKGYDIVIPQLDGPTTLMVWRETAYQNGWAQNALRVSRGIGRVFGAVCRLGELFGGVFAPLPGDFTLGEVMSSNLLLSYVQSQCAGAGYKQPICNLCLCVEYGVRRSQSAKLLICYCPHVAS